MQGAHKSSRALFRRKRNPVRGRFSRFRNLVLELATTASLAETKRVKLLVARMVWCYRYRIRLVACAGNRRRPPHSQGVSATTDHYPICIRQRILDALLPIAALVEKRTEVSTCSAYGPKDPARSQANFVRGWAAGSLHSLCLRSRIVCT